MDLYCPECRNAVVFVGKDEAVGEDLWVCDYDGKAFRFKELLVIA